MRYEKPSIVCFRPAANPFLRRPATFSFPLVNPKSTFLAGGVSLLIAVAVAPSFAQTTIRRIQPDSIRPPAGYLDLRIQARTPVPARQLAQIFADLTRHTAYFPRFVADARQVSCAAG